MSAISSASDTTPPHLTLYWPDGKRQQHRLLPGRTRIGRDPSANQVAVPPDYNSISRLHLEVLYEEGNGHPTFRVVDLDSANGVFVNGQRLVGSAPLNDGDEIHIGLANLGQQVRLVFSAGSAPSAAQAPAPAVTQTLDVPRDVPYLRGRWPDGREFAYPIGQEVVVIGRDPRADLTVPESVAYVAPRHAEVRRTEAGYAVVDLGSPHGTRVNGQAVLPGVPMPLRDAAIIRFSDDVLAESVGLVFHVPSGAAPVLPGYTPAIQKPHPVAKDVVTLGRAPGNDVVLDSPTVSAWHARLERRGERYFLVDQGSLRGTRLNGQPVRRAELHAGDLVEIEQIVLLFQGGQLWPYDSLGLRVDVVELGRTARPRPGASASLHGMSLTVLPREFVAVVGSTGSGRRALLDVLAGVRLAEGHIWLNGRDFDRERHGLRAQVGYVLQASSVHPALTVERALDDAARLRLPPDTTPAERARRLSAVLDTVGLNTPELRRTRVGRLSPEARQRVSLAVELLADPKLLLLDEPTADLDPGQARRFMHTLRRVADEGRTVIVTTQSAAGLAPVDHTAWLADGRLVFFGPPSAALGFFKANDAADVFNRLAGQGAEWHRSFTAGTSGAYEQYVTARQQTRPAPPAPGVQPAARGGPGQLLRQLSVLTRRAFRVLTSEAAVLALLLLLSPLAAALLVGAAGQRDVLTGDPAIASNPAAAAEARQASYTPLPAAHTLVMMTGIGALFAGMVVPSIVLARERAVYRRERLAGLQVPAYVLSHALVFVAFALPQAALYLAVVAAGVNLPASGAVWPAPAELFVTLFLTHVAGAAIGLLVSALARSTSAAAYALLAVMAVQFAFSGALFDLRQKPAEPLSYLTAARWSITALGATARLPRLAESTIVCTEAPAPAAPCAHFPAARDTLPLPYQPEQLGLAWATLGLMSVVALFAAGAALRRLDAA